MKITFNFNSLLVIRKNAIIILLALFLVNILNAQNNYIEAGKKYSVAKLVLKNYQFIKARNLTLIDDSTIKFNNFSNGVNEVMSVKNVQFLSIKKGTFALTYGLVGAGIGLVSVVITQVKNSSNPLYKDFNYLPIYIGLTAGCAAVGAIIGACIPKWRNLSFKDNRTTYSFVVLPNVNWNYYGLANTSPQKYGGVKINKLVLSISVCCKFGGN